MLILLAALPGVIGLIFMGLLWLAARRENEELRTRERGCKLQIKSLKNDLASQKKSSAVHEKQLENLTNNFEASNTHFLSQALVGQTAKDLRDKTKEVIEKRYSRMSQELLGNVSDEAEGLSREFHLSLCERIWDSIQQLKEKHEDSPYIMPPGCRIAYTKGHRTVVVIEQAPQVRTVSCTPSIVGQGSRNKAVSTTGSAYRFNLAFPYVYFVIAFDKSNYTYHELYFRNKPLSSVREHIYLAPIPNVFRADKWGKDSKQKMCMGSGFKDEVREELTVCRQAEIVVSDFWLRTFNDHLGLGGFDKIPELKTWGNWQDKSDENPLFILKVKWKKGKTIKGVVDDMLDSRGYKHKHDGIDKNLRKILDKGVASVTKRLKEEIQSSKDRHALKDSDLNDIVRDQLEHVVCGHSRRVFEHCQKG